MRNQEMPHEDGEEKVKNVPSVLPKVAKVVDPLQDNFRKENQQRNRIDNVQDFEKQPVLSHLRAQICNSSVSMSHQNV
jgi:hypothetical protein